MKFQGIGFPDTSVWWVNFEYLNRKKIHGSGRNYQKKVKEQYPPIIASDVPLKLDNIVYAGNQVQLLDEQEFDKVKSLIASEKGSLVKEVLEHYNIKLYRDHPYFEEFGPI